MANALFRYNADTDLVDVAYPSKKMPNGQILRMTAQSLSRADVTEQLEFMQQVRDSFPVVQPAVPQTPTPNAAPATTAPADAPVAQ